MPTEPTLAAIRERFADEMWPWGGDYFTIDDIRADVAVLLSTIEKLEKVAEAARATVADWETEGTADIWVDDRVEALRSALAALEGKPREDKP